MHRAVSALIIAGLFLSAGCDKTKRLSYVERDHFQALKVFMTDDQRKAFLKNKTEEERNAYLRKVGLWEAFYKYDERKREDILKGDVKVGWDESAVNMAWGRPHGKNLVAGRLAEQSYELKYRFEVDRYGDVTVWTPKSKTEHKAALLYQVQLVLDDGRVAKMVRTDCVPNWNYCEKIKWTKGQ
ncbi:MAG: hypothetical protein EA397_08455 [Deltaproteobacteria bacterium]|nr:MAG: hypothetical protein EA397_08455 [Deltaproteobacteria bacterium]